MPSGRRNNHSHPGRCFLPREGGGRGRARRVACFPLSFSSPPERYSPTSDPTSDYPEFRRRLDDALRKRDPAALRDFLIAEGQWTAETTTDPEAAMWMMIATSPALASQRDEARHWLMTHGYEAEAQAIFGAQRARGKAPARRSQPHPKSSASKPKPRQNNNKRPRQ